MEPALYLTAIAVILSWGLGFVLGRKGWFVTGLVLSLVCGGLAWLLMFQSHLIGWEGMGPGIVAIVGLLPAAFGMALGTYIGRWRAQALATAAHEALEAGDGETGPDNAGN